MADHEIPAFSRPRRDRRGQGWRNASAERAYYDSALDVVVRWMRQNKVKVTELAERIGERQDQLSRLLGKDPNYEPSSGRKRKKEMLEKLLAAVGTADMLIQVDPKTEADERKTPMGRWYADHLEQLRRLRNRQMFEPIAGLVMLDPLYAQALHAPFPYDQRMSVNVLNTTAYLLRYEEVDLASSSLISKIESFVGALLTHIGKARLVTSLPFLNQQALAYGGFANYCLGRRSQPRRARLSQNGWRQMINAAVMEQEESCDNFKNLFVIAEQQFREHNQEAETYLEELADAAVQHLKHFGPKVLKRAWIITNPGLLATSWHETHPELLKALNEDHK